MLALGPFCIILLWGMAYLLSCYETLSGQGGALEYKLETPGGRVTARTESWYLDAQAGFAQAVRVTLRDPDGQLLASANKVKINGLRYNDFKRNNAIDVRGEDVFAMLRRDKEGAFDIQRYVPETPPSDVAKPIRVVIRNLKVKFVDDSGPKRWSRFVTAPTVTADVLGARWKASTLLSSSPLGPIPVEVAASPAGIRIDTRADSDITEIVKQLQVGSEGRAYPDFAKLEFDRISATGPISVFVPSDGAVRLLTSLSGTVRGFRFEDYSAEVASFAGTLDEGGGTGKLEAQDGGVLAEFEGSVAWKDGLQGRGSVTAKANSKADIPKWIAALPEEANFSQGSFAGEVAWRESKFGVQGRLLASQVTYGREALLKPSLGIAATDAGANLTLEQGSVLGFPIQAALSVNQNSKALTGWVRGLATNTRALTRRFGTNWLEGSGQVTALVSGTASDPAVVAFVQGSAAVRTTERRVANGPYRARVTYENDILNVRRFAYEGDQGDLSGIASWNVKTDKINGVLFGGGFPLAAVSSQLKGNGIVSATFSGTSKALVGRGKLEAYAIEFGGQELPFLQGDLALDNNGVTATDVVAVRGAAKVTARFALSFRDKSILGSLEGQGIQISSILGSDYAGTLSLEDAKVRGTLDKPIVEGTLVGVGVVAQGIRLGQLQARGVLDGNVALLDELRVDGRGTLTASGSYNIETNQGLFSGNIDKYELRELNGLISEDVRVSGLLNGDFSVLFDRKALRSASLNGGLQDVAINRVPIGAGQFDVNTKNDVASGSFSLGTLDSFIEIPEASYDLTSKELTGKINLLGIPVQTIAKTVRPYLGSDEQAKIKLPVEVISQLTQLTGDLEASADVSGTLEDPTVKIETVGLKNLTLSGDKMGDIVARGVRENRVWTLDDLTWTGGPGEMHAKGRIEEHGNLSLEGEWRDITAKWFSVFEPRLSEAPGVGEVLFTADGPTKSPNVTASLAYRSGEGKTTEDPRRADALLNVANGKLSLDGSYFFDGFTGSITGSAPFNYPFEIPKDGPISARISLPRRDLKELAEFFPSLDPAQTVGEIGGQLRVEGTLDNLRVFGAANLNAPSVGLKDFATRLNGLQGALTFDGDNAVLNLNGDSSLGGNFALHEGKIALKDWDAFLQRPLDTLLDSALSGSFELNQLRIKQDNPRRLPTGFNLETALNGTVGLGGTVRNPLISSKEAILIDRLRLQLPAEFAENTGGGEAIINPSFNLDTILTGLATLETSTGNFGLSGGARIRGSLEAPDISSDVVVEKGSINLPNAKITLEPGGNIALTYRSNTLGDAETRADVDLVGRTGLTAPGIGGQAERYNITLNIRGDLLREGGLTLSARSDPPGLSQDRILNLLGQGDILMSGNQGGSASRIDRQLQTAITQIALPALVDSYTSRIATQLGLDYFAFEYNPFENLSVTVAKSFGKGLTLQFRRQLSEPKPGERPRYDLRMYYRPPFRRDLLGRFSFSFGLDQDRPWKLSVEYGFRF